MADMNNRRYGWSGFSSTGEYLRSLPKTPKLFYNRAGYVRDPETQMAGAAAARMLRGACFVVHAALTVTACAHARCMARPGTSSTRTMQLLTRLGFCA